MAIVVECQHQRILDYLPVAQKRIRILSRSPSTQELTLLTAQLSDRYHNRRLVRLADLHTAGVERLHNVVKRISIGRRRESAAAGHRCRGQQLENAVVMVLPIRLYGPPLAVPRNIE